MSGLLKLIKWTCTSLSALVTLLELQLYPSYNICCSYCTFLSCSAFNIAHYLLLHRNSKCWVLCSPGHLIFISEDAQWQGPHIFSTKLYPVHVYACVICSLRLYDMWCYSWYLNIISIKYYKRYINIIFNIASHLIWYFCQRI